MIRGGVPCSPGQSDAAVLLYLRTEPQYSVYESSLKNVKKSPSCVDVLESKVTSMKEAPGNDTPSNRSVHGRYG